MPVQLTSVYNVPGSEAVLWELLQERTPQQSISHQGMPSWDDHVCFIKSKPYHAWFLIENDALEVVGSVYLTRSNEIGIFIFERHKGRGYGKWAVREVERLFPGPHLANINPQNQASRSFFESLGARWIQVTYLLHNTRRQA